MVALEAILNLLSKDGPSIAGSPEGETYVSLAMRHRLLPLLGQKWRNAGLQSPNSFQNILISQKMKSMLLAAECSKVTQHLERSGTRVMVLKGPVLSYQLYGDVAMRQYNDLDLYVHPEDLHGVLSTLDKEGYQVVYPDLSSGVQLEYYFRYKRDVGLRNRINGAYIELHSGINTRLLIPKRFEESFYQNVDHVSFLEGNVMTLRPEYNFIFLCIHGAKHLFSRLIWLKDLVDFLNRKELNHAVVQELVEQLDLQRVVGVSVRLAEYLFDTNVAESYREFAHGYKIDVLFRICLSRILGPERENWWMKIQKNRYFFLLKADREYRWLLVKSLFHRRRIRIKYGGH